MDKVTAAMVLTSLSTSPLVRSPPVKVNGESLKHPARLQAQRRIRTAADAHVSPLCCSISIDFN